MKTFLEESVSEILSTPSNLESLIIVLPSRRAGVFFKEALVSKLTKPSLAPKIFSVEEFIQEISTLKLVPTTSALITFFEIYSKLTPKKYLDTFKNLPYIFNLGHGLLPETDPDKVSKLIKFYREY